MSNSKSLKYFGIALLLNSFAVLSAFAADAPQTSIGGLAGIGTYNNNIGTKFTWGAKVHHKFMPNFGAGITFTDAKLSSETVTRAGVPVELSQTIMHFDADLVYHFADMMPGLWAGARLGLGRVSTSASTTVAGVSGSADTSNTAFEFGPSAGYDFMIADNFSVGADLSYLFASYNGTSINTFQALGAVKFHF